MVIETLGNDAPSVLVLDDHPVVRDGLADLLHGAGMHVVGSCATAESALQVLSDTRTDVALVDLLLDGEIEVGMDGLAFMRAANASHSAPKLVVLSAVRDEQTVQAAYDAGAAAFLPKLVANRETILSAIRAVLRGERLGDVESVGVALRRTDVGGQPPALSGELSVLSPREREVLACVASGADNLKIAAILDITERTVRAHVSALYRKLGRETRTELALMARDLGLKPRMS